MNYSKVYDEILNKYGTVQKPSGTYTERHHVIPKCIGGTNDAANLLYVPTKVHFICHKLLCKMYNEPKLKFAFWAMCNQLSGDVSRKYVVTSHTYNKAKEAFAVANSMLHKNKKISKERCDALRLQMTGNSINPKGADNPLYGKPRSEEVKQKIRETKTLHPERNWNFKGYYITPIGVFPSAKLAAIALGISENNHVAICKYCKFPDKIISTQMTFRSTILSSKDVGKSLRSLGWGFQPINLQ